MTSLDAKLQSSRRKGRKFLPFRGEPGLIIAIDIGTTFSGASYCFLVPGSQPIIEDVKSFPGQSTSSSKVPSVVLYDADQQPRLFGAEAVDGALASRLIEQGGEAAQWWKLHLKPRHLPLIISETADMKGSNNSDSVGRDDMNDSGHCMSDPEASAPANLDPLPFGLKPATIAAHFLAYMASCVGAYIAARHSNGATLLQTYADTIRYIITIPNDWEIEQQQILRVACVEAGLTDAGRSNSISFVSEAEASVNFCAQSTSATWLETVGQEFIVCDAGGGTIDVSSYRVQAREPALSLIETSPSDCLIAGSAIVDRRARELLTERLQGTEWDNPQDLEDLQLRFCSAIKETFAESDEEQYLSVGSAGINRPELNIRRGKLVFSGQEIASLFEPSIASAEATIRSKLPKRASISPMIVAMVGGFSESIYFRKELQSRLGALAQLCKPDEATAKAVASGAVAWLVYGVVSARMAKVTYGVRCNVLYLERKPAHYARRHQAFKARDGRKRLPSSFGAILKRGESGAEDRECVEAFTCSFSTTQTLTTDVSLFVYRGNSEEAPSFIDEHGFEELCKFRADLEQFRPLIPLQQRPDGTTYIRVPIRLAIRLCGTEIHASILFDHQDKTFRSPATVTVDAFAE